MSVSGQAALWCLVQLSLISIAVVLLAKLVGRRNPFAGVWCLRTGMVGLLFVTLLATAPFPSWFSMFESARGDSGARESLVQGAQPAEVSSSVNPAALLPTSDTGRPTNPEAKSDQEAVATLWKSLQVAFDDVSTSPAPPLDVRPTDAVASDSPLVTFCVVGLSVGTIWFLIGVVSVKLLLRPSEPIMDPRVNETLDIVRAKLSCRRNVRLVETERIASAATVGFFSPVILLPSNWYDWSDQELEVVLAHEIAHVQAHDFAATVMGQFVVSLHFFHPFVHYLAWQLRTAQELAADASASTLSGGRSDYATVLAGMALRTNRQSNLWATQAFLPAPRTLLRRIEMLRDAANLKTSLRRTSRVVLSSVLVLTICAVAGLRANPATAKATPLATGPDPVGDRQESKPLSLDWIPNGSMAVLAFKPAEFLRHASGKPLAKKIGELSRQAGIAIEDLDSITVCQAHPSLTANQDSSLPRLAIGDFWILRSRAKTNWNTLRRQSGSLQEHFVGDHKLYSSRAATHFMPDEFTLVSGGHNAVKAVAQAGQRGTSNRFWHDQWNTVKDKPAAAILDLGTLRDLPPRRIRTHSPDRLDGYREDAVSAVSQIIGQTLFEATAPIWSAGELLTVAVGLSDSIEVRATVTSVDQSSAEEISQTTGASLVLVRNMLLRNQRRLARAPAPETYLLADLAGSVAESLKNATSERDGVNSRLSLDLSPAAIASTLERMAPQFDLRATDTRDSLRHIALALHNYHDVYKRFPPAYSMGKNGNGKHPVSWRVLITPFIERNDIFESYAFDEPWDSEHNKKVTADMPSVFRIGGAPAGEPTTNLLGIISTTDKLTGFGRHQGHRLRDFLDGTSNSLLVVEAKRRVHWAKPEDIEWDPTMAVPEFGGVTPGAFYAAMADGSCQQISRDAPHEFLRAIITIQGQELVNGGALRRR